MLLPTLNPLSKYSNKSSFVVGVITLNTAQVADTPTTVTLLVYWSPQ